MTDDEFTTDETEDETDDEMLMLDGMSVAEVEAMGLSRDLLQKYYDAGELSHLSLEEMRALWSSASHRDLQKTIMR